MIRLVRATILGITVALLTSCHATTLRQGMTITSLHKTVDTRMPVQVECQAFTLNKSQVVAFFKHADEVSGPQFHNQAIILPCMVQGTLTMDGSKWKWSINAGGGGFIYQGKNGGKQRQYLCHTACQKALPGIF